MRRIGVTVVFLFLTLISFSQRTHIGLTGGLAAYEGDLVDKAFPKKVTNGAIGLTVNYELADRIILRGGLTYMVIGGADRYSSDISLVHRNLSFETSLTEFSAIGEYYLFDLYEQKFSPYIFAGLAVFHFNPYAYDINGAKVYLKPLSTEGEGLQQYPNNKPYSLIQPAIPFGGGIKYAVNDNLRVGLEFGLRKLFTDYLDDVSTNYADFNDLLAAKGPEAISLAYRGDEVSGGNPNYPSKGTQRGGATQKDWYYVLGLHITYRLGVGGGGFLGGNKRGYGCPNVPR